MIPLALLSVLWQDTVVPPVKQPVSLLLQLVPLLGYWQGGVGVVYKFFPSWHPVATGYFVWEPCSSVYKDRPLWALLHSSLESMLLAEFFLLFPSSFLPPL